MWQLPDPPINLDIDVYSKEISQTNNIESIWDELDLTSLQQAGSMQRRLNLSGVLDPSKQKSLSSNELPVFKGLKSLAMAYDRMQFEWIGITRAAARGTYRVKWQNWCGYELLPTKLIGRNVQILGLRKAHKLNETCGIVESYDSTAQRFGVSVLKKGKKKTLNVNQANLFYEFSSPYCCPNTPLCCNEDGQCGVGECSWVNVKQLLISAWWSKNNNAKSDNTNHVNDSNHSSCFLHDIPPSAFKLILSFARPHGRPSVLDFTERCRLKIKWKDPTCTPIDITNNTTQKVLSEEEINSTSAIGRAGTSIIEFYDSMSMAMELHCMIHGYDAADLEHSKEFQDIEEAGVARLARLECYHHLYWSAVLHFSEFNTCIPNISSIDFKKKKKRHEVKAVTKIKEKLDQKSDGETSLYKGTFVFTDNLASEVYLNNNTRKQLPVEFLNIMTSSLQNNRNKKNEKEAEEAEEGPVVSTSQESNLEQIPVWIRRVKLPYDRAFKAMFDNQGEAKGIGCIYYASESGCASPPGFQYPNNDLADKLVDLSEQHKCLEEEGGGNRHRHHHRGHFRPCQFLHDSWWKKWVIDVMAHPRLCGVCGQYGSRRCSRCMVTYYCSEKCQQDSWKFHKLSCVSQKKKE